MSAFAAARDILVEFKGAYFLPTDSCFKKIYHGGALYGPEVTFKLCNNRNWYGFASADFFSKTGCSIGLRNLTKVRIAQLALGLKYMVSYCYGDLYVGLGFQPVHVKTINCSPFVARYTAQWGFGGIAKVGTYITLPCNFFLDLFVDYSFVRIGCKKIAGCAVNPVKANISGAIFGAGIGYRFN